MVQITTVPSLELSFFVFKIFHILSQLFIHKWVSDSVLWHSSRMRNIMVSRGLERSHEAWVLTALAEPVE